MSVTDMKHSYKDARPQDTIFLIRKILHDLDINLIESYDIYANNLFSHRLVFHDLSLNGTNGKGTTALYSLASAYGEFMERLQNSHLLFEGLHLLSPYNLEGQLLPVDEKYRAMLIEKDILPKFIYYPDEELVSTQATLCENIDLLTTAFSGLNIEQISELLQAFEINGKTLIVPFYNVAENTIRKLPYYLLRTVMTSNGMCAGNTDEEALSQGLCEIFERYALMQIFIGEVIPPEIPLVLFDGTDIYQTIKGLIQTGYQIRILDCSLQIGLPVIGLLVLNPNQTSYHFHMGADAKPEIALERCFTEMYQGNNPFFHTVKIGTNPFEENLDTTIKPSKAKHYFDILCFAGGRFPNEFILTRKPSYTFTTLSDYSRADRKEEFKALSECLFKNGYELYIRNNSSLGFPAFHLYVPGMSEVFSIFKPEETALIAKLNRLKGTLYNLPAASDDTIKRLADSLDACFESDYIYPVRLKPETLFPYTKAAELSGLPFEQFMLMLLYFIGDNQRAYKYCNYLIQLPQYANRKQYMYFYLVRDYLYLKNEGHHNPETMLTGLYPDKLLKEVTADMQSKERIFDQFRLPVCFNCEACPRMKDCLFTEAISIVSRVQKKQSQNIINQIQNHKYFQSPNPKIIREEL